MANDVRELFDPFVKQFQRLPSSLDELTDSADSKEWKIADPYNPASELMIFIRINDRAGMIYSVGPDEDDDGGLLIYDGRMKGSPTDGDIVILLLCVPRGKNNGVQLLMGYASSCSELDAEKYLEEISK